MINAELRFALTLRIGALLERGQSICARQQSIEQIFQMLNFLFVIFVLFIYITVVTIFTLHILKRKKDHLYLIMHA